MSESIETSGSANFDMEVNIRERIVHVLGIWPKLSFTMLHIGLGTSTPSAVWKRVLRQMQAEGVVQIVEGSMPSPNGRVHTYQVISLVDGDDRLNPQVNLGRTSE